MVKTASGSSGKDVLKLEKRVIELELEFKELKESVQNIDLSAVPEMKEKLDSVESMITVEQAAILELKKLLETGEKPAIPEDLEQRLATIETNVQSTVNKTDFDARIEGLQKDLTAHAPQTTPVEMENLYNKITQLESTLTGLKTDSEKISNEVEEKLKEVSLKTIDIKQPTIDYDLMASKIEAGKDSIDELSRSKLDLELKIAEIMKKIEIIGKEFGRSPEQRIIDGLKINRKEIVGANARIDSLERVARELMGDTQTLEKSVKKFESLERIALLGKDIEDKVDKIKFIEDEVKRLTSKIQTVYDDIDNRLDKLRGLEKKYSDDIPALREAVESNKVQIEKIKKDEHQLNKHQIIELRSQMGSMRSVLNNLNGKIASLENIRPMLENKMIEIRKSLYPIINQGLRPINKRADFIEKKLKETRTSEIGKILTDVTMRTAVIEERIQSLERSDESKMAEFRTAVRERLGEIRAPPVMDHQFKELVNRMIFLESRLMGIEKMMQEKSNALPIIIE